MPSEPTLAVRLGVSRAAVREALIRLEERGYLHRSQGTDTSVNRSLLSLGPRIDEQRDQSQVIETTGARAEMRVVRSERVVVSPEDAERFAVTEGSAALMTVKVWSADGRPVTMATDTLPLPDRWEGDLDPEWPVFEMSRALGTAPSVWETVQFCPIALGAVEAWLLGVDVGALALRLHLHGLDASGATAYWSTELQLCDTLDLTLVRHIKHAARPRGTVLTPG